MTHLPSGHSSTFLPAHKSLTKINCIEKIHIVSAAVPSSPRQELISFQLSLQPIEIHAHVDCQPFLKLLGSAWFLDEFRREPPRTYDRQGMDHERSLSGVGQLDI